jgi:lipid II:glycine glycyltransferase (peptidoglycan interpeptide bridge formation enzyme)
MDIREITDEHAWNQQLSALPYAHILQSWQWGEFKRDTTGWNPRRLAFYRGDHLLAMASIGIRRIGPFAVIYAPKGIALDYHNTATVDAVLTALERFARRHGAIWLKIDPDLPAATGVPTEPDDAPNPIGQTTIALLQRRGWRYSSDQVQFRNTITIDLTLSEDDLLAAMSQNTRRKVRTAEKKGVTVRHGTIADLPILYELYRMTGERDQFLIRPLAYYLKEWRWLIEQGLAQPLIAEVDGIPIAHVILFHFGRKCWYFYGASANDHREKMPNYLLQWEAIRWAKAQGYTTYDLWGAPNEFHEGDSMWGVYEFKRGFRGTVTRYIGAWDYAPFPPLYRLYTEMMPRVIAWMRQRR